MEVVPEEVVSCYSLPPVGAAQSVVPLHITWSLACWARAVRAEHGYAQSQLGCHHKLFWLKVETKGADGRSNKPGTSIGESKRFQPGSLSLINQLRLEVEKVVGVNPFAEHLLGLPPHSSCGGLLSLPGCEVVQGRFWEGENGGL